MRRKQTNQNLSWKVCQAISQQKLQEGERMSPKGTGCNMQASCHLNGNRPQTPPRCSSCLSIWPLRDQNKLYVAESAQSMPPRQVYLRLLSLPLLGQQDQQEYARENCCWIRVSNRTAFVIRREKKNKFKMLWILLSECDFT